MNFNPIY